MQFEICLTRFRHIDVILVVLEFTLKFHSFCGLICRFRCYFGDLIVRVSSYDVITLVTMFGLEPEGLIRVSDEFG